MIDTIMVGQLGEVAIASVGLGNQILEFLLAAQSLSRSSGEPRTFLV